MRLAADPRFEEHPGLDWRAWGAALDGGNKAVAGAPTIAQRAAGNLLVGGSGLLDRWHAAVLALAMTHYLPRPRIMEIFLSTAELGPGIYGVPAAAQHYWGKSGSALTPGQCLLLAATLADPHKHNPATRTPKLAARAERLRQALTASAAEAQRPESGQTHQGEPVRRTRGADHAAQTSAADVRSPTRRRRRPRRRQR
jgi:monofunctional biosynthetic peptidoglycan transglycosylase